MDEPRTDAVLKAPAFQFFPKEFLSSSKVCRMANAEVGIYVKLLCHEWMDGSLPTDHRQLARMVGVPFRQFSRTWEGPLSECFVERNGRLVNPRLERARKEQIEYRRRQAEHGKKGGRPKGSLSTEKANRKPEESSASASPPASAGFSQRRTAPLVTTEHRTHAACGRVCVPAFLHNEFTRRRNHPGADRELRDWYLAVDTEWQAPPRDREETGEPVAFWRARYDERWPVVKASRSVSPARSDPWWYADCPHPDKCGSPSTCERLKREARSA